MKSRVVVVNGLPGVGKTSLASKIAHQLGWPLLTKDMIKESLFESIGWGDRPWSRKLSVASMDLLFLWLQREALAGRDVVIEGNFDCERDTQRFLRAVQQTTTQWVQVLVVCDGEVLLARHRARGLAGKRHPGHHEGALIHELQPRLQVGRITPLDLPGDCFTVDTTDFLQVNPDHIVQHVWSLLEPYS
jgi:predicted kinase